MLSFKLPHITHPNPVFTADLEGVRYLRSARSLLRYTLLVVFIPLVVAASWWLLTMFTYAQASKAQRWEIYTNFENGIYMLVVVLLFAAVIAALKLDVYIMDLTVNSIRQGEFIDISPTDYFAAKYALAQVRAWRVLALEVAVRLLIVVSVFMAFTLSDNCFIGDNPTTSNTCGVSFFLNGSPLTILLLGVIAVLGVVIIMESFWRMHVLTAIGLLISATIQNQRVVWLTAFAAIIGVHLLQAILIFAIFEFLRGYYPILDIGIAAVAIIAGVLLHRRVCNRTITSLQRLPPG